MSTAVRALFVKAPGSAALPVVEEFRRLCPSLLTYWGYSDRFPDPAEEHLGIWVELTEGSPRTIDPTRVRGTPYGEYVGVWSVDGGYVAPLN